MTGDILTLNAGSSSIKFALFEPADTDTGVAERLHGQIEGLGAEPHLIAKSSDGAVLEDRRWADGTGPADHHQALDVLITVLDKAEQGRSVAAVGHRVVHGGIDYSAPVQLDADVMARLEAYCPLAPLHQPHNLSGIRAASAAFADAPQIACFDTAFHRTHPWVEDTFALPRSYFDAGVRRYGFHGLSYEYIADVLARKEPDLAAGRVVVAHLGNGASLCAIQNGRSVASTMGFTALDGLPMGTRCGQIDAGVVLHLIAHDGLDVPAVTNLLYKQSGLKGLSGISQDMRALEQSEDPAAKAAIDYFVHRIRREIGALAAVLGGLDALVFTAGIGEHSDKIRAEVCAGFDWIGLTLDEAANAAHAGRISTPDSAVSVLAIPTDEEAMIARHTQEIIQGADK